MKSKLLYGLFLSSMFISIDATAPIKSTIKTRAQENTITTNTYISEPVNQTFTEKTHTNPIGGSTTVSNWNSTNQITGII